MIVTQTPTGWAVAYQRAHGLLAFAIASHWHPKHHNKYWLETLLAIAEHDEGQENWTASDHLNAAGAPLDFHLKPFELEQAERTVQLAGYKSRWMQLLISMHTTYLYTPIEGEHKGLPAYLATQAKLQASHIKALDIPQAEAENAYRILHWADRCSLILLRGELPDDARRLEVFATPANGPVSTIAQRPDGTLAIDPWPFDADDFPVWAEVRHLAQLAFRNDKDLYAHLLKAEVEVRAWRFRK